MNGMKPVNSRAGYDQEEAYFHKENLRLIEENKAKQNQDHGSNQPSKNNVIQLDSRRPSASGAMTGPAQKKAA
jgi:hypothetical protein